MTEEQFNRNQIRAQILKAFAHPTRLFIVERLKICPHCVCELTDLIGADASTVSKHLSILKNAGLISSNKKGTTVYYALNCPCIGKIIDAVETVVRQNIEKQRAALE